VTVVGVVAPVKRTSVFQEMGWSESATVWRPLAQQTPASAYIAVRAADKAARLHAALEGALAALDPDAAVGFVEPVDAGMARLMAYPRFRAAVFGGFAVFALLLAAAGLHGVLSQMVAQRTQEIGVRMALGARPSDIARLVAGQGSAPVLAGLAAGMAAALGMARWIATLLYGVQASDPVMLGAVSLVLLIAAAIAMAVPARRAARANPVDALRQE
jgi:ABC-type antimicrobial peptide transport system permease subunit